MAQPVKLIPVEVPREGNYFWQPSLRQIDHRIKQIISVIFDQNGEMFLLNEGSHTVYWAHETCSSSYSLYKSKEVDANYKSKEVDNYIDFHPEKKLLYHHNGSLTPKAISFNSKEEDLQKRKEDLERKIKEVYPTGKIVVKCSTSEFELDYQSGKNSTEQTEQKFAVKRHDYQITFLSPEPATVRWELKFSKLEATFPNSNCPCMVYHSQNLGHFIALCNRFFIKDLPGGILVSDLEWMNLYRSNKIKFDVEPWVLNKKNCDYEGSPGEVVRFEKKGNALHNLKELRLLPYAWGIIQFFGWQEDDDFYYLAMERCELNFEDYIDRYIDITKPLYLGILRDLAIEVYLLHTHGVTLCNLDPRNVFVRHRSRKPRLGLLSFMTDGDRVYTKNTNLQSLGKLMLQYSSGGAYKFNSEEDLTPDQLNMCELPELRHLITWLTGPSPPQNINDVLAHPWLWDSHTVIQFISTYSDWLDRNRKSSEAKFVDNAFSRDVFTGDWNVKLDANFVAERVAALSSYKQQQQQQYRQQQQQQQQLPQAGSSHSQTNPIPVAYDFTKGCSLLRIFRNAFNHHGQMREDICEVVGKTKEGMLDYFRGKFPRLVMTLHATGNYFRLRRRQGDSLTLNLKTFYEVDKTRY